MQRHLIRLGILFLFRWCVWWFSPKLIFFSFSLFLPFLHQIACWSCKKSYQLFIFNFFIQFLFFYLQLFYLHGLFLIRFYFWFHPYIFAFFNLFSNLIIIFWAAICFVLNHFLDWFFFSILSLDIYFHLIFMSNLTLILLIVVFLIIFLMDLFLQLHP